MSHILFHLLKISLWRNNNSQFTEGDTEAWKLNASSIDIHALSGRAPHKTVPCFQLFVFLTMPQDSRSQKAIISECQQELSVSTTLNEFLESYRTPSPLLPASLSSSPFLQYAFNVSRATGNLQYARESEIKENVFTLKKFTFQWGDKTNHCSMMHQMSQSCLVK